MTTLNKLLGTVFALTLSSCGGMENLPEEQQMKKSAEYTCETGVQMVINTCCRPEVGKIYDFCVESFKYDFKETVINDCSKVTPDEYPDPLEYFRCMKSFCEGTNQSEYHYLGGGIQQCKEFFLDRFNDLKGGN